jgi:hypothetical protein
MNARFHGLTRLTSGLHHILRMWSTSTPRSRDTSRQALRTQLAVEWLEARNLLSTVPVPPPIGTPIKPILPRPP